MNSYISINPQNPGKLLKRYSLITIGKQEILKALQKRSKTWSCLKRLARKIKFKESITNKNK